MEKLRILLLSVVLALSATVAGSQLEGTVSTGAGVPLPYAYVSVEGKSYAAQADKNGKFVMQLPDGTYTVTAQMLGYKPDKREVEVNGATTVAFVLEEDLINLGILTVTGTRTPRVLGEAPVVTRVITEDDIKKTDATNIKDVLTAEIPGLEFTFAMDQQVMLNMQGLGGMSILILVDGERLAGETFHNTDFQRLNTDNIERIEIIKGAASALYGSNSVGAVINIITKKAAEGWAANMNTHFSAHGEQRHGGSASVKSGKWSSITNVQTNSTDTYTIHDTEGDGSTVVYGNRQWNFKEKLLFQHDEHNKVTVHAGYYFHERDYSSYEKNRSRDFNYGLRWQSDLGKKTRLDISYTLDRYDKSNYYTHLKMDFLNYKNLQNSIRAMLMKHIGSNITWIAGADAMRDYLMSYQFEDNGSHSQYTADIFTQAEWRPGGHWDLIAGLRGDWLSSTSWNVSPRITAMYTIGKLNIRGSYSRGFLAPTLKEKYMNFDISGIFTIYGNDNLASARSHSFTLSGEYAYKRYSITATGYYNMMSNEISVLWDPSREGLTANGSMVYQNVAARNLAGADITVMARYPCGIGATVSYSYFHEIPRNGGYNLSSSRPHSLTLKADYRRTFHNYDFDVIFSGRVLSSADYYTYSEDYATLDAPVSSPAYSIWRLALSQRFFNAYTLLLSADNLFNYRPKVFTYTSPVTTGTSFGATLSIDAEQIFKKRK